MDRGIRRKLLLYEDASMLSPQEMVDLIDKIRESDYINFVIDQV